MSKTSSKVVTTNSLQTGTVLTISDIDQMAVSIGLMWDNMNKDRRVALERNEEVRAYLFGTDVDSTTARNIPYKNRTHQPKLTQISDNLQSQYWDACLSMTDFFKFDGTSDVDRSKAPKIEAWVRTKLEQKKFRETTGRALLADFVNYGNAFAATDYVVEKDANGKVIYKGPIVRRISPMDIGFNPRSVSFRETAKIERIIKHMSEVMTLADDFPNEGFDKAAIEKAIACRNFAVVKDWVAVLKERGLKIDGFADFDTYFRQDMVELLVYRGDMFDPDTGKSEKDRVIYVMDRSVIIRNAQNKSPPGYDGLHHAPWRLRNDNLWGQGALDNIVGMQYRIDHLENLKADVFDLIAHPVVLIKGEGVQEPDEGYGPGRVYYCGEDEDVKILVPDSKALQADTQIETYHRKMEEFAGSPPESRGIRTPGEKTAFEINKLDSNATKMFVDKARMFEIMIENVLHEVLQVMLVNFDGEDFARITNDITGAEQVKQLALDEVQAAGNFIAVGASYWSRRNRETVEMRDFQMGPMQDPKIRMHVSGEKLAAFYEARLGLEDQNIIEPFAGTKEDVTAQMIAKSEADRISKQVGMTNEPNVSQDGGVSTIQPGQQGGGGSPGPAPQQPGTMGLPPMVAQPAGKR